MPAENGFKAPLGKPQSADNKHNFSSVLVTKWHFHWFGCRIISEINNIQCSGGIDSCLCCTHPTFSGDSLPCYCLVKHPWKQAETTEIRRTWSSMASLAMDVHLTVYWTQPVDTHCEPCHLFFNIVTCFAPRVTNSWPAVNGQLILHCISAMLVTARSLVIFRQNYCRQSLSPSSLPLSPARLSCSCPATCPTSCAALSCARGQSDPGPSPQPVKPVSTWVTNSFWTS